MKKDFAAPIIVLTLICLVVTTLLAVTNSVTAPRIAEAAYLRENAAKLEIIPDAESFEELPLTGLPEPIREASIASNGEGYIFTVVAEGYKGEIKIICGISPEGTIIACKTLESSETQGIGTNVTGEDFTSKLTGKDSSLEGISAVSGATVSSKAYLGALADVFTAFEAVRGA